MTCKKDNTCLLADLERHEGFRSAVYMDSRGYLTIGIGRLIDGRRGGGITHAEAQVLLENDVNEIIQRLSGNSWFLDLNDPRKDVIANMAYNLGIHGLYGFKEMISALEKRDYARAAVEMLDSSWARQVNDRAHELAVQMRSGRRSAGA